MSYLAPLVWNNLPHDVKDTIVNFKKITNLFKHKVEKNFLDTLEEKDGDVYVYNSLNFIVVIIYYLLVYWSVILVFILKL